MNSETVAITRTIKRFAPWQLGKILGVLQGAMGLIAVPFFLLVAVAGAMAPASAGTPPAGVTIAFGVGMAIAAPLIYALFGFLTGIVGAFVYNLVAKWVGGIEVQVE